MKFHSCLFYGLRYKRLFPILLIMLMADLEIAQAQEMTPEVRSLITRCEKAMGGRAAYDRLRHITWNFFGNRTLTWDKHTGDVRIDMRTEKSIYLINVNTRKGRIYKNGKEYTQPDSVARYLKDAYEIWVNDSYWLVMPWKLRDPGLEYIYSGPMTSLQGFECDVIQLTFKDTGVTPENKYLIYFDKKTGLICQWDFYKTRQAATPLFSSFWTNYRKFAGVQISGDRGERDLTDIHVFSKLPESVYKEFNRPFYLGRHDDI